MRYTILLLTVVVLQSCKKAEPSFQTCTVDAPKGLSTLVNKQFVKLSWSPVFGATSYEIGYKNIHSSTWDGAAGSDSTSTWLPYLDPDSIYIWKVKSDCMHGSSDFSSTDTFRTHYLFGQCNWNHFLEFTADTVISDIAAKTIIAYADSSYVQFQFSSYPLASNTYQIVSPTSSVSGNTAIVTAHLQYGYGSTYRSTGLDQTTAVVTVTAQQTSISLSSFNAANATNNADTTSFYGVTINLR